MRKFSNDQKQSLYILVVVLFVIAAMTFSFSTAAASTPAPDTRQVGCGVIAAGTKNNLSIFAFATDSKTLQRLNTMKLGSKGRIDVWSAAGDNQGILFKHCEAALRKEIPASEIDRVLRVLKH